MLLEKLKRAGRVAVQSVVPMLLNLASNRAQPDEALALLSVANLNALNAAAQEGNYGVTGTLAATNPGTDYNLVLPGGTVSPVKAPNASFPVTINAPAATAGGPARSIDLNLTGLAAPSLHITGPGSGILSAAGYQPLAYNDFDQLTITGGQLDVVLDVVLDAGTAAGDGSFDKFSARRNGPNLELVLNGVVVFAADAGALGTITVQGSSDDGVLVVDNSGGLVDGVIRYDGGTGASRSLGVRGGAVAAYDPNALTSGSGILVTTDGDRTQTIEFTNLTPTILSGAAAATLTVPGNGANLTIDSPAFSDLSAGDQSALVAMGITSATPFSRIQGTFHGGTAFETMYFADIGTVTLDAGSGDANPDNPDDNITIAASGLQARGLQNFIIQGTAVGNNTLTVHAADFALPVAGGGITLQGGRYNNTLVADANVDYTLTDLSLTSSAGGRIEVGGLTQVDLTNTGASRTLTVDSLENAALSSLIYHGASTSTAVFGDVTILGDLSVTAGTIAQDAATSGLVVTGSTTLSATTIMLAKAGNDFGAVNVTSTGNTTLVDHNSIILGTSNIGGNFKLTAPTITQAESAGGLVVGVLTTLSGTDITLDHVGNDFGTVAVTSIGDTRLVDKNNLDLGTSSIGGNLSLTATTITQSAASGGVVVSGLTTLVGTTITLNHSGNDFNAVATTSTGDTTLADRNTLALATASVGGRLARALRRLCRISHPLGRW